MLPIDKDVKRAPLIQIHGMLVSHTSEPKAASFDAACESKETHGHRSATTILPSPTALI